MSSWSWTEEDSSEGTRLPTDEVRLRFFDGTEVREGSSKELAGAGEVDGDRADDSSNG